MHEEEIETLKSHKLQLDQRLEKEVEDQLERLRIEEKELKQNFQKLKEQNEKFYFDRVEYLKGCETSLAISSQKILKWKEIPIKTGKFR
jgi:hypothetical protein